MTERAVTRSKIEQWEDELVSLEGDIVALEAHIWSLILESREKQRRVVTLRERLKSLASFKEKPSLPSDVA